MTEGDKNSTGCLTVFCSRVRKILLWLFPLWNWGGLKVKNENELAQTNIPSDVEHNERILRGAYHPMNFNLKKNEIQINIFRSPALIDEVSVIRFNYITLKAVREFLKIQSNPEKNRIYRGFCILIAEEIFNCGSKIVPDFVPIPQHANIIYGYTLKVGEPAPLALKLKWETLLSIVKEQNRYFEDPNINSDEWEGKEINI